MGHIFLTGPQPVIAQLRQLLWIPFAAHDRAHGRHPVSPLRSLTTLYRLQKPEPYSRTGRIAPFFMSTTCRPLHEMRCLLCFTR